MLDVLKGKRRVARITGQGRFGCNRLTWRARRGGKPVAAGRYTLTLTLLASDGQATTLRGRVTITR